MGKMSKINKRSAYAYSEVKITLNMSYKKQCKIKTSGVSYITARFAWFSFLKIGIKEGRFFLSFTNI